MTTTNFDEITFGQVYSDATLPEPPLCERTPLKEPPSLPQDVIQLLGTYLRRPPQEVWVIFDTYEDWSELVTPDYKWALAWVVSGLDLQEVFQLNPPWSKGTRQLVRENAFRARRPDWSGRISARRLYDHLSRSDLDRIWRDRASGSRYGLTRARYSDPSAPRLRTRYSEG